MLLFRAQALSASVLITIIFDACIIKVLFWDLILVAQHELQGAWRVETLWEAISWIGVLYSEVKMVVQSLRRATKGTFQSRVALPEP